MFWWYFFSSDGASQLADFVFISFNVLYFICVKVGQWWIFSIELNRLGFSKFVIIDGLKRHQYIAFLLPLPMASKGLDRYVFEAFLAGLNLSCYSLGVSTFLGL